MPLNKGAKPGSKGFKKNIETEVKAGKSQKQAVAIAYSESGEKRKDKAKDVLRVSRDAKGRMHVFLPGVQIGRLLGSGMAGVVATVARGDKAISLRRKDKGVAKKPKDMREEEFERLKSLLAEWINEEEDEPEHQDAACSKDSHCDCADCRSR